MRTSLLMLLVLCGLSLRAQKQGQALIDSLEQVLKGQADDTNKVRTYVQLTRAWVGINPRKGFAFADKGLRLAQRLSWQQGIANLNNGLGLLTGDTGNNEQARIYFEKSLAINRTLDAQPNIIANLSNLGRSYEREADFTRASTYYFQALGLAEEIGNNEQSALVGTNILAMYVEEKDFEKAMTYGDSTVRWGIAAHALIHVAKAYEMMGVAHFDHRDISMARKNYDTAMAIYQQLGNEIAAAAALANRANLETDPEKAIIITLRAQAILDTAAPMSQFSIGNMVNLGGDYLTLGEQQKGADQNRNYALAAMFLARADSLSKLTGVIAYEPELQSDLSDLAADRGDFKTALTHYKRYTFLNDSIFSQDSKNNIAKLESQRAIDLKNKEIENKGLQISNQRRLMAFLIIGVALLGIIGVILWRQGVTRKRTNKELVRLNAELNEANKVKAKFLGILSHDLRSPIARLLNFLQLQKKKPDSLNAAEKEEYWTRLSGSATTLLETMEATLLWSKGQMEVFKPHLSAVKMGPVFERLRRFFADVPGVSCEFTCEDGLTADTDEDYLWTILQNLTANAIQALSGTDAARLTWTAWREGNRVYCRIDDNGPGVTAEQLRALYDETVGTGARQGLGLYIIRDLAKAIDCRITMNARKSEGTEFLLLLKSA